VFLHRSLLYAGAGTRPRGGAPRTISPDLSVLSWPPARRSWTRTHGSTQITLITISPARPGLEPGSAHEGCAPARIGYQLHRVRQAAHSAQSADSGRPAGPPAAHGAALAEAAGFRAQPLAVQGTPAGKAVIDAADDHDASLIVLGSHGRAGLGGRIAGSVAADVASRSQRPVLIVHDHGGADDRALEPSAPADASEAVSRDRLR
jgi:nucleotide-binding universal stress UspA family protein